jgi:hypothetical protein
MRRNTFSGGAVRIVGQKIDAAPDLRDLRRIARRYVFALRSLPRGAPIGRAKIFVYPRESTSKVCPAVVTLQNLLSDETAVLFGG